MLVSGSGKSLPPLPGFSYVTVSKQEPAGHISASASPCLSLGVFIVMSQAFSRLCLKLLPESQIPNVRAYYLLILFTQSYILSAVWLYFFLQFVDYSGLGVIDGLAFAIAWCLDIPTGALADRFGRRWLLIAGCITGVFGGLVMGVADGALILFAGNLLYLCAYSFFSGAQEALVYESLSASKLRFGQTDQA